MTLIFTIINTVLLVIVLSDRIKQALEKTTWDDKIVEAVKKFLKQEDSK